MYKRNTALAVVLASLLAAGCGSTGGAGDFNLISIEEEWQLGNQLSQDVEKQVRLNNDPAVNAYVREMGQKIVAQAAPPFNQLPWNFHVVQDESINAFAIPGGHVYVNSGLIEKAPNVAAFTGALAHEISHGVARHSTEQLSRAYGLEAIGGAVLGQNPAVYEQILASILAQGAMARFSRSAESEADRLGAAYMYKAGYDPQGMVQMFQTLLAERKSRPGSVERFFASHPLTEDRIREVQKEISGFPNTGNLIASDPRFEQLQDRFSG